MKKSILIVLVLLLLLTGCRTAPTDEDKTLSSTPSSSGTVTPPSSSVPATSIPATSAPVKTPNSNTGYPYIHKESIDSALDEYDLSDCIVGYLYWLDEETYQVTLLLAESISMYSHEGSYIYYVKETEPIKIYRMLITDPAQSEKVLEAQGAVSYLCFYPGVKNYLQYVVDNKNFSVLDLNTGEEMMLMEQYYINLANMGGKAEGVLGDWIWFEGKITEEDKRMEYYFYNRFTGEIVIDTTN